MKTQILISGFGGQGMMKLGKILAEVALSQNKNTSWFPSYGAEMRGGTAHCFVKISDRHISSPFIGSPDIAVIFNQPSLAKFKNNFSGKTKVILNTDLIQKTQLPKVGKKVSCPLNKIALSCGSIKVANIIALGIIFSLTDKLMKRQIILSVLEKNFPNKKKLKQNLKAFSKGEDYVKS
ncbi:MAG: 2-oxoacid:acceptor oxidoreductase family protein [Candidatus Omnitrophica bacterium]|nr:2-oxoacid:acceptor oxidoreductase family protein [Candidatus Omnitrophota bacterium]MCF7895128.1 2-oxoacid:acceptor oxidoreductase family protein [Candidatus Omnitrophota bacterium]